MTRHPALRVLVVALGLATTTGCLSMTTDHATPSNASAPSAGLQRGPTFRAHTFGGYCYNTRGCRITYANRHEVDALDRASGARPDETLQRRIWTGHHIVDAAPQVAHVQWISRDGTPLQADIDVSAVFADHRIVHNVPSAEIAQGVSFTDPAIVLVVDDRVVEVYMRALVPLNHLRDPSNRYSDSVDEPVLVMRKVY